MIARLARVLIAAALLAGWQAALLHPLEHFDEHGGFVHLADGHSRDGDSPDAETLCDALAALAVCAPDAGLTFGFAAPSRPAFTSSEPEALAADAPPFLAQGPPALL